MPLRSVLVTGSCGLIGAEVCVFFARQGFAFPALTVTIARSLRSRSDTSWALDRLRREIPNIAIRPSTFRDARECSRW